MNNYSGNRQIRVFISSTFSDMQAERDELVKFVFPQLRSLCESRGVVWGEVDLRWGITDEEKSEGKVLPLCLEEIKSCRPYFIGLLGERYGWVPDEIPPALLESQPWLSRFRNHSVTELEILHGVLNDPGMAEHAFFYLRDPAFIKDLPEERRHLFEEGPLPDELVRFGQAEADRRAEERKLKLQLLKERIKESGFPVREDYPGPKSLGELVLKDMTRVIDKLFPEGSAPDPLARETADHWLYANARSAAYLGRQEYFDALDSHAASDDITPLVILGESGTGKSALLSSWALRYKEKHPDVLVIPHFIGATSYSSDSLAVMRRIMGDLKRQFNLQETISDKPDEIIHAFEEWLKIGAVHGKIVIILDALNQMEDTYSARDLVWIPEELPAEIRLIASTLPGQSLEEIVRRNWKTLSVQPFAGEERREFLLQYLGQYSKKLPDHLIDKIVDAPQTSSPIYLKTLLEELRIYGDHQTLSEKLELYLCAHTIEGLYEKILGRYEQDYDRERPGLVHDSLTSIMSARNGLAENELLEILGESGLPLPHALWAPLSLAAREVLTKISGLLAISHENFRAAIRKRYLGDTQKQRQAHSRLAGYFGSKSIGRRKVEELPYQLITAGLLDELHEFVVDLEAFNYLYHNDKYHLLHIWESLSSSYSAERSYGKYLTLPDTGSPGIQETLKTLNNIGAFFHDLGLHPAAKAVFEKIISFCSKTNRIDAAFISSVYNNLGVICEAEKDDANAKRNYHRAIEVSAGELQAVSGTYHNNLAQICYRLGEQADAEKHYLKAIELFEAQYGPGNIHAATCLSALASLLVSQAWSNAIADKNIAGIVELDPDILPRAESMAKEALHVKELYYGRNHREIVGAMNVLADIYSEEEKYKEAEALLSRSLTISKTIARTTPQAMISTIDLMVDLYVQEDEYQSALSACREAIRLKETHFGPADPRTVSAVRKREYIEKLQRDNLASSLAEKYFAPLIENHYIPIPFPFIRYFVLIAAIYYGTFIISKSSSVILSILIASIITGAYTKTVYTYKQAKKAKGGRRGEGN
jgi:tetratricopeptide (TPR) repeat protein